MILFFSDDEVRIILKRSVLEWEQVNTQKYYL